MAQVEAINEENVGEVAAFLCRNLNPKISPESWAGVLSAPQPDWADNHGFVLRDGAAVTGCYGAIYSSWPGRELDERFCSLHSWCVAEEHRSESFDLVRALLRQRGLHFFNPTPNPLTVPIFEGLRFRHLDNGVVVFLNPLGAMRPPRGATVTAVDATNVHELPPELARAKEHHGNCSWIDHLLVKGSQGACYVAGRQCRWRGLRAFEVLHLGSPELLLHHLGAVQRWLLKRGVWVLRIERRMLPAGRYRLVGTGQPRMALSRTLSDGDFSLLYTDLAMLRQPGAGLGSDRLR